MSLILKRRLVSDWKQINNNIFTIICCVNSRAKKQVYCLCNACCLFILGIRLQIYNLYTNPSCCSPLYTFVVINPYLTLYDLKLGKLINVLYMGSLIRCALVYCMSILQWFVVYWKDNCKVIFILGLLTVNLLISISTHHFFHKLIRWITGYHQIKAVITQFYKQDTPRPAE